MENLSQDQKEIVIANYRETYEEEGAITAAMEFVAEFGDTDALTLSELFNIKMDEAEYLIEYLNQGNQLD
tara:strand:- start:83 stop:292 length:210 start_codon:yes stop_codon:yes gene_type:complete